MQRTNRRVPPRIGQNHEVKAVDRIEADPVDEIQARAKRPRWM
jgi:hypothetical protein